MSWIDCRSDEIPVGSLCTIRRVFGDWYCRDNGGDPKGDITIGERGNFGLRISIGSTSFGGIESLAFFCNEIA